MVAKAEKPVCKFRQEIIGARTKRDMSRREGRRGLKRERIRK